MADGNVIKQFIDSVKEPEFESNKANLAVVSRVDSEGIIWVHLAGAQKETPTASTSSEVKSGDIVSVEWRNNKLYIGGNYTNPSIGFQVVRPSVDYVNELLNKDITVNSINAATGYIGELESEHIRAKDIIADHAEVENLDANYAHITEGVIDNAKIGYADVNDLNAHYARITNGVIDNATIDHANVNDLNVAYVQADLANIDQAIINQEWVDTIMVQSGLISHEGTIFELDAVQVNASKIKAGTLDVERLIVSVPDQQDPTKIHKYMVHVDPTTGTPSYEKVDADILEDLTITADKIIAGAITAEKITTKNIIGPGGWINLRNGTFAYADAGENNYLKWNGSKLQIKADEFMLSTGQNILDAIESIETYFLSGEPTLENEPAVNWTTDNLKNQHLRDVYYDNDSGKAYRWSLTTETPLENENGEKLEDADGNHIIGVVSEATYGWIQLSDGDISSISDRVSVAETNIAQNQTDIQTKASQTDLDLATTRLTQAETTIAQNSQAIALKAEASSVYSKLEIDGKFHEGMNIRTSFGDTAITLSATVILAGVNVNDSYMPGDFEWFYRTPDGDEFVKGDRTSSYGKSITINKSNMKYGQSVICVFTKREEDTLTDENDAPILDDNDDAIIGHVEVA